MPVERFRSLVDAERALRPSPDPSTGVRTALFLASLAVAARHGERTTRPGVERFPDIATAELAGNEDAGVGHRD